MLLQGSALVLSLAHLAKANSLSARTYQWQPGQAGYNGCGTTNSEDSLCQTAVLNSLDDFCLWGPPSGPQQIGDSERYEIAYCTNAGHGTRTMPAGTIQSAHYLSTPHYTQITGTGDFTKIHIQAGDEGGELDPHGADGNGNPIGGIVTANGVAVKEWTSFISATEFCFRVCDVGDGNDWLWCQHSAYDLQGCEWNEPGNYGSGFDSCEGDSTELPPGIYSIDGALSTYQQGDGSTPAPTAHAAGPSSNCQRANTVGIDGPAAVVSATTSTTATSSVVSSAVSSAVSLTSSTTSFASSVVLSTSISTTTSIFSSAVVSSTASTSITPSLTITSTVVVTPTAIKQVASQSATKTGGAKATSTAPTIGLLFAVALGFLYLA